MLGNALGMKCFIEVKQTFLFLPERKKNAINWEFFFYRSYLQGAPFLPAWLTQSRSIEDLFKNQTCLQCQITAGFMYFHGLPTVVCIKDNCDFLLKRILKFSGSFIWRWENRSQRSEKALWSWQRSGGYRNAFCWHDLHHLSPHPTIPMHKVSSTTLTPFLSL